MKYKSIYITFLCISTFTIRETQITPSNSPQPPYDIINSGMPATGIRPIVIAILINICKNNNDEQPIAVIFPNTELVLFTTKKP